MSKRMMTDITRSLLWILMLGTFPRIEAGEALHEMLHGICIPDCIRRWSADDYCPKPFPCLGSRLEATCDDYRAKAAPCPIAVRQFECDDYCPKAWPHPICPPVGPGPTFFLSRQPWSMAAAGPPAVAGDATQP
jgi:hypothetical protein